MRRIIAGLALLLAASYAYAGTATIKIDSISEGTKINQRMHGIFLEEINFGVDGGLYAELIRNRGFEDAKPPEGCKLINGQYGDGNGWFSGFAMPHEPLAYWSLVQNGDAKGSMRLDTADPLNDINPRSLKLEIDSEPTSGRIGIANEGFWGINCVQGETYKLSFHARCLDGFNGSLTAVLEDGSGDSCTEPVRIYGIGPKWKRFSTTLVGSKTNHRARFVLTVSGKGTIWFDSFSLFPTKTFKDRQNGTRTDIARMLADLKPGFMRFPGGCVVEGGTIETAYNWKKTIGPLSKREEIWNDWSYRRTHGMGFFEYLQLAEDIGADPLFVGFAGQTCAFRCWEHVPMNEMSWVVNNFLDAVEYANGPETSTWGALRAKAGHPKPFNMNLLEIGNENMAEGYIERYPLIYNAIKEKYPKITTIACFEQKAGQDMVDHHYYNNPFWFLNNNGYYDNYDRKAPKVYVGEYAVNSDESGPNGNIFGGLAEASFALGMQRNGDVVRMCSYAPLLANQNAKNWKTNLINFDSYRVFGSPSYYVQKMLSTNCPSSVLPTDLKYALTTKDSIQMKFSLQLYGTNVELKDVKLDQGEKNIYTSDFAKTTDEWTKRCKWQIKDGALAIENGGDLILDKVPDNITNYTVSCKIKKTGGNEYEGFIIGFGKGAGNIQWNIGGWGEKRCAIQGCGVDNGIDFKLEHDHWYDVKIEVEGAHVKAYLDGKLLQETTAPETSRVFALAGIDETTNEMIIEAVNTSPEKVSADIDTGTYKLATEGTLTVLKGRNLMDENTLENPMRVIPVTTPIQISGDSIKQDLPPYSFCIIRARIK